MLLTGLCRKQRWTAPCPSPGGRHTAPGWKCLAGWGGQTRGQEGPSPGPQVDPPGTTAEPLNQEARARASHPCGWGSVTTRTPGRADPPRTLPGPGLKPRSWTRPRGRGPGPESHSSLGAGTLSSDHRRQGAAFSPISVPCATHGPVGEGHQGRVPLLTRHALSPQSPTEQDAGRQPRSLS